MRDDYQNGGDAFKYIILYFGLNILGDGGSAISDDDERRSAYREAKIM